MLKSFSGVALFAVALVVAGCGAETGLDLIDDVDPPGAQSGELVVHVFDFEGHSEVRHSLRLRDGTTRELRFPPATNPGLPSGASLRVFGTDDGQVLTVSRFERLAEPDDQGVGAGLERRAAGLFAPTKKPTKKWALVLVDTGNGVNITKEEAARRLFSAEPTSIASYYKEVSYGVQELAGDVLGPFSSALDPASLCQNFPGVIQELSSKVTGTYDQVLWYFGSRIPRCNWLGVALLGSAQRAQKHSFYNASAACVVLVQEPGHNFGMVHSSALHCKKGTTAVSMIVPGDGECIHDEYGSPFDPMGGGTVGAAQELNRCYHMNGVQKAYQEWLGGCNIVKAATSGIYTIYPLEQACNGVQMLQVPLAAPRVLTFRPTPGSTLRQGVISSYYVELRAPIGLDARLQTPRVLVTAADELRGVTKAGNPNWVIDMKPQTDEITDAQLPVGATFADPAPNGPKIHVISADATKAVIQVQLAGQEASMAQGTGQCDDRTAFQAPGPTCDGAPPLTTPPVMTSDAGAPADGGGVANPPPATPGGNPVVPGVPQTNVPDAGPKPITMVADAAAPEVLAKPISSDCGCRLGDPARPVSPASLAALALVLGLVIRRRRGR